MNIALVHNLPSGGAKRNTFEQMKGLKKRGYKIYEYTFSTTNFDYLPFNELVESTKIYPLNWIPLKKVTIKGIGPVIHLLINIYNIFNLTRVSRKIAREIDCARYDLVFLTDCRYLITPLVLLFLQTPSLLYLNTILNRAEKYLDPKTQSTTNVLQRTSRYPIQMHKKLIHDIQVMCLKKASYILTNSQFSREDTLTNFGVTSEVLYPGVDIDTFSTTLDNNRKEYVLSVGSLIPEKGHNLVIECMGLLPPNKRLKVIIAAVDINSNYMDVLYKLAGEFGVDLEIKSAQTSGDMARIYQGAYLLAFAPSYESFGLVVIEAMACGTPVIGVNEGGLCETIIDGENGYLVDRDVHAFSQAMQHMIEDPDLRDVLGNQARKFVETRWSWDVVINHLDNHINTVVK